MLKVAIVCIIQKFYVSKVIYMAKNILLLKGDNFYKDSYYVFRTNEAHQ